MLRRYAPECTSSVCTTRRGKLDVGLLMSSRRVYGAVARSRGIFVVDRLGRPECDCAGLLAWGTVRGLHFYPLSVWSGSYPTEGRRAPRPDICCPIVCRPQLRLPFRSYAHVTTCVLPHCTSPPFLIISGGAGGWLPGPVRAWFGIISPKMYFTD